MDIHSAITNRNIGRVRELLEEGVDLNDANSLGWTPLSWAAFLGNTDIINLMLQRDPELDTRPWSPLASLFYNGHGIQEARPLIERGASIQNAMLYVRSSEKDAVRRLHRWAKRRQLIFLRNHLLNLD